MSFLGDPDVWPLDEQDQDAELVRRAARFASENPRRVLALAVVKLLRFWSPWPNAEELSSPALTVAGAAVELPLFGLLALGALESAPRPVRGCSLPVRCFISPPST